MTQNQITQHIPSDIPVSIPNIPFHKDFMDDLIRKNLGVAPSYWRKLYGNYEITDKKEVRKFISQKRDNFKRFLLFVPKIINKEFMEDKLFLKISNNYKDEELLKIYIKTSYSPRETANKINKIEDKVFSISNSEILNNIEISVEF